MKWNNRLTDILNIKYPIIQGGLAYLAYAELAAAVSNSGGLGQITAMSINDEGLLKKEIRKVKNMTNKAFGVNFAIGQRGRKFNHLLEIAIEEKVPVISITGGNPKSVLEAIGSNPIKKLVLTATKYQAEKAEELGADAVIVVGQEGGGHIENHDIGTNVLTPLVVDSVSVPVISSGGIVDGKGMMSTLALGAEGIEMGTRFIATQECVHAHSKYKQALINADEFSTTVIKRSLGTPARAIKNSWTDTILQKEREKGDYNHLKNYISGEANKKYIHFGKENEGFGWAGQGASRIASIPTVDQLIKSIIKEAEFIRKKWSIK